MQASHVVFRILNFEGGPGVLWGLDLQLTELPAPANPHFFCRVVVLVTCPLTGLHTRFEAVFAGEVPQHEGGSSSVSEISSDELLTE